MPFWPFTAWRKRPSAIGLRQMFPVQTKRTCFTRAAVGRAKIRRRRRQVNGLGRWIPRLRLASERRRPADLQTALFPSATLAEFFRFALLLTGSSKAAEQVMADTLAEVETQLGEFRCETNRQAWLATRIRQRCQGNHGEASAAPRLLREADDTPKRTEILRIEAYLVAQRFHQLPEPERSALALFYLELFSVEEIAQLLKLKLDQFAETIGRARALLRESLQALPGGA